MRLSKSLVMQAKRHVIEDDPRLLLQPLRTTQQARCALELLLMGCDGCESFDREQDRSLHRAGRQGAERRAKRGVRIIDPSETQECEAACVMDGRSALGVRRRVPP